MAPHLRLLLRRRRSRSRRRLLSIDSRMSRTPKRARKITYNDCADRLSDLPDAVLCHILSFLDTKYAVATTLLSTRWKNLFISLPNIVLDDSLTLKTRNEEFGPEFAMFGLRQIMLRNVPHINQFHLKCNFNFKDPVIQTLVYAAIWRNVKEVDICMGERAIIGSLPPELFTSTSLVVLKLKGDVDLVVPEFVSLPNLKVLHLDGFMFQNDDSINRFFRGCKLLEDLCLSRCIFWRVNVLDLSIPFLRKVSFNHGDDLEDLDDNISITVTTLVLDTPNLELFEYRDHIAKSLRMKKLTSHARAEFFLPYWDNQENASVFINKLRGFKALYLSMETLQAMYPNFSSPSAFEASVFESLTHLELAAYNLRILPSILECAPQLEVLVIHEHSYCPGAAQEDAESLYPLPEIVPICLAKHLSNIEFRDFQRCEHEFELMKYLLQNGKVLKRMKISAIGRSTLYFSQSDLKKLKMLQRFSETCEIVFEYDRK
ncbi:F-box/FBD/LRR-repeat protein [Forsythia ovata]|uniref:F-box/FBD/LRR-repeat protein n=1 Tax=Forsythia ovata TaxID=205694 RepID=A0ABD1V1D1_9LAMI